MKLTLVLILAAIQQPTQGLWARVGEAVTCEHETRIQSVEAKDGSIFLLRRQYLMCGKMGEYRITGYLFETAEPGSRKVIALVKKWDLKKGEGQLQLIVSPKITVIPVEDEK